MPKDPLEPEKPAPFTLPDLPGPDPSDILPTPEDAIKSMGSMADNITKSMQPITDKEKQDPEKIGQAIKDISSVFIKDPDKISEAAKDISEILPKNIMDKPQELLQQTTVNIEKLHENIPHIELEKTSITKLIDIIKTESNDLGITEIFKDMINDFKIDAKEVAQTKKEFARTSIKNNVDQLKSKLESVGSNSTLKNTKTDSLSTDMTNNAKQLKSKIELLGKGLMKNIKPKRK